MSRRARVRGLAFDVDGVLTDGTVSISSAGDESKRFSVQDGTAFVWCRMLGYEIALVSGRASGATALRAEELGKGGSEKEDSNSQKYLDELRSKAQIVNR